MRTILIVKLEKKTREPVWLKLRGYHVVALKPEFEEHAVELENAIQGGMVPAYPDLARAVLILFIHRL